MLGDLENQGKDSDTSQGRGGSPQSQGISLGVDPPRVDDSSLSELFAEFNEERIESQDYSDAIRPYDGDTTGVEESLLQSPESNDASQSTGVSNYFVMKHAESRLWGSASGTDETELQKLLPQWDEACEKQDMQQLEWADEIESDGQKEPDQWDNDIHIPHSPLAPLFVDDALQETTQNEVASEQDNAVERKEKPIDDQLPEVVPVSGQGRRSFPSTSWRDHPGQREKRKKMLEEKTRMQKEIGRRQEFRQQEHSRHLSSESSREYSRQKKDLNWLETSRLKERTRRLTETRNEETAERNNNELFRGLWRQFGLDYQERSYESEYSVLLEHIELMRVVLSQRLAVGLAESTDTSDQTEN